METVSKCGGLFSRQSSATQHNLAWTLGQSKQEAEQREGARRWGRQGKTARFKPIQVAVTRQEKGGTAGYSESKGNASAAPLLVISS